MHQEVIMRAVIAGFPGIGKTHLLSRPGGPAHDLDGGAYKYSDATMSETDPKWPQNYLDEIVAQANRNIPVPLLISSYPEVISALIKLGIVVTLVYPGPGQEEEYMCRYRKRGSTEKFQEVMETNFRSFLATLSAFTECRQVVLQPGQYLSDVIHRIM